MVLLAVLLAVTILPVAGSAYEEPALFLAVGLSALLLLATIVGVIMALIQRLQELRGGEEEDAKKY